MTRHPETGAREAVRRYPWPVDLAVQALLVVGAALLYFRVRRVTEGGAADAIRHGYDILRVEQWLHIDVEESFQNLVLESHALTTSANWVYIWGHWPVIALTLIWLHRSHHRDFILLRNAIFVSGAIGLVIFALYPVAPPRHLSDRFVDTVTELSRSYRVLQPPQLINEYAAMPSLHMGWNLLVGVFLFHVARHKVVRAFGFVVPVLMGLAVVATGNHYILDAVVGSAVALAGLAGSHELWRLVYARRAEIGDQSEIIDDDAGDTPRREFVRKPAVDDRPSEQLPAGGQPGEDGTREQSLVGDHAVDRCR